MAAGRLAVVLHVAVVVQVKFVLQVREGGDVQKTMPSTRCRDRAFADSSITPAPQPYCSVAAGKKPGR